MTAVSTGLAAGLWRLDSAATRAEFRARDALRKQVLGTLPVLSGSVRVDDDGTPISAAAELDLTGVDTGNARRDKDLRGTRFFDVQASSTLVFRGGRARPDGPGRWLLPGTLTLKGVRCDVELVVELVTSSSAATRVRATTTLDRRRLGILVPRALVGRQVDVGIDAELAAPGR